MSDTGGYVDRHLQVHRLRNCVRACQTENDVPEGYFRTWVERYHVDDYHLENPVSSRPTEARKGFRSSKGRGKVFLRSQDVQPLRDSPCTQVCPVGATFISPMACIDRPEILLGCAYCVQLPLWLPLRSSDKEVADKCTLCYHRITKG